MWPIVLRNLLATWVICGFWDWFPGFHKTCGEDAKARMSASVEEMSAKDDHELLGQRLRVRRKVERCVQCLCRL